MCVNIASGPVNMHMHMYLTLPKFCCVSKHDVLSFCQSCVLVLCFEMNINFADWQVSKKVGCSVQSDENAAQAVQKIWLGEGTIEEMDLQLSPKKNSQSRQSSVAEWSTVPSLGIKWRLKKLWFARDIWRYRNVFWLIDWLIEARLLMVRHTTSNDG